MILKKLKKNKKNVNLEEVNEEKEEKFVNPFHLINAFIESEGKKYPYSESLDIYGTVDEYLEICL